MTIYFQIATILIWVSCVNNNHIKSMQIANVSHEERYKKLECKILEGSLKSLKELIQMNSWEYLYNDDVKEKLRHYMLISVKFGYISQFKHLFLKTNTNMQSEIGIEDTPFICAIDFRFRSFYNIHNKGEEINDLLKNNLKSLELLNAKNSYIGKNNLTTILFKDLLKLQNIAKKGNLVIGGNIMNQLLKNNKINNCIEFSTKTKNDIIKIADFIKKIIDKDKKHRKVFFMLRCIQKNKNFINSNNNIYMSEFFKLGDSICMKIKYRIQREQLLKQRVIFQIFKRNKTIIVKYIIDYILNCIALNYLKQRQTDYSYSRGKVKQFSNNIRLNKLIPNEIIKLFEDFSN